MTAIPQYCTGICASICVDEKLCTGDKVIDVGLVAVAPGLDMHYRYIVFCASPSGPHMMRLNEALSNLLTTADTHLKCTSLAIPLFGAGTPFGSLQKRNYMFSTVHTCSIYSVHCTSTIIISSEFFQFDPLTRKPFQLKHARADEHIRI